MGISQSKEDKSGIWLYLPNTVTLYQYLNRSDLIELSKCCKSYRNQLEHKVLENLDLNTWSSNNRDAYNDLMLSMKFNNIIGLLKSDLGDKLKYAKKVTLDCFIFPYISEYFVKLLPNIKSLKFSGSFKEYNNHLQSLVATLNDLEYLEHVDLGYVWIPLNENYYKEQLFPLSLKSLNFSRCYFDDNKDGLMIHDTIDSRYTNLYSLEIVSNRMLQNLSCGMPNLQEVVINDIYNLDKLKLVDFLIANSQLKKINISCKECNDEIFKTILSSKYLEHFCINRINLEEMEANNLPLNFSIKYLDIYPEVPSALMLKFINACVNLETLDLYDYWGSTDLNWLKLNRRINILKINNFDSTQWAIKIDTSKSFDQVHIILYGSTKEFIDKYNIGKLKNYKFSYSESKFCKLKLINK